MKSIISNIFFNVYDKVPHLNHQVGKHIYVFIPCSILQLFKQGNASALNWTSIIQEGLNMITKGVQDTPESVKILQDLNLPETLNTVAQVVAMLEGKGNNNNTWRWVQNITRSESICRFTYILKLMYFWHKMCSHVDLTLFHLMFF